MKKRVFAMFLAFVMAFSLVACGSSDNGAAATGSNDAGSKAVYRTLDEIKESGTINIGVFSDKNPFGMWMRTASIRDMMYIMQEDSVRIWVSM